MASHVVGSEVELVRMSMNTRIARAITEILEAVPGVQTVEFDRIRLLASDFNDMQLPGIQLIDIGTSVLHEHARAKKTWRITLELVMKENEHGIVSQEDLWNFVYKVERALWRNPNLQIPGVLQMTYVGNTTDLHLLQPYYLAKLDFDVLYYEDLVRPC
jgi:hypothetical protein